MTRENTRYNGWIRVRGNTGYKRKNKTGYKRRIRTRGNSEYKSRKGKRKYRILE